MQAVGGNNLLCVLGKMHSYIPVTLPLLQWKPDRIP